MMIDRNKRRPIAAVAIAALLTLTPPPGRAAEPGRQAVTGAASALPFARVYLALRGCTSCAHCRTAIRQMVRSTARGAETAIADDKVEVRYPTPRTLPLRDVIHTLAQNRLHDLNVVDVLFEATGTLAVGKNGTRRFVLRDTGQSFPISVSSALERSSSGKSVRLVAMVDGWRGKGAISLVAREVRAAA